MSKKHIFFFYSSYQTAARRMRKLNKPKFELMDTITQRQTELIPHIVNECEAAGFKHVTTLGETHWKRPIMVFKSE